MIDLNADHIGFVLTAYGIVAAVLLGLLAFTLAQAAKLKRTLSQMKLPDPGQKETS
jgi:heme exporter protein CcmD